MTRHSQYIAIALTFSVLLPVIGAALADEEAQRTARQVGVGAQYDTTHVYVAPEEVGKFEASFLATFGGQSTKQVVAKVTPTPSSTTSQLPSNAGWYGLRIWLRDPYSLPIWRRADRLFGLRHRRGD